MAAAAVVGGEMVRSATKAVGKFLSKAQRASEGASDLFTVAQEQLKAVAEAARKDRKSVV